MRIMLDSPKLKEKITSPFPFFRPPLSTFAVNPIQFRDDKHKPGFMKHKTGMGNQSGKPKKKSQ